MNYLSETIPVYKCPGCLVVGRTEAWDDDPYSGLWCKNCNRKVKWSHGESATWWSIGIYNDAGSLIFPQKQRVFESLVEAKKYMDYLHLKYIWHEDIVILGFTEQLPVDNYECEEMTK